MDYFCQKCGACYSCREDCEPSYMCDACAHELVGWLLNKVPKPPKAITWELGTEILNKLQETFYKS